MKRKKRRHKKAGGHMPIGVLNKRLVKLNSVLSRRPGGKSFSGNAS